MTRIKIYPNSGAFRAALEARLQTLASQENTDLQRLRRGVAFDRFLARLFFKEDTPWVLKGGYAMELRIKRARATKDIDLAWKETFPKRPGAPSQIILAELQDAAAKDLEDFFIFIVGEPNEGMEGAPYGGARYPVETRLDGRLFVTFHLDMGIGDAVIKPYEETKGRDWLHFAGIPSAKIKTISSEQHFAEKLHAYTQPRETMNSRVRDLVDMVLLIQSNKMNKLKAHRAMEATFKKRKSHSIPIKIEPPPREWQKPFSVLAEECHLSMEMDEGWRVVNAYFQKIN